MGVNKLNSILKDMCEAVGIPPKTNHAGRKTLVQKENGAPDNGVPPNQIIQITGHKNLQSINNYRATDGKHFKHSVKHGVDEL
ncbi:unnamed protein product [Porites lobata]|uniref:Tyr recombinase domain-containing protein n=1 Tax=Porites lobata TaxID=104759 RepID=A0ABN8NUD6_9CNID|nr:unnamed protein product [Porites lobata]